MVDNYDSFTYNLVHLLEELGAEVVVRQSDSITPAHAEKLAPDRLVVSPGPGRPAGAGRSLELILHLGPTIPTLGVCLGHQSLVEAYGGRVVVGEPIHGKDAAVNHDGRTIFAGLPDPLLVGRYHSLIAAPRLPDCFELSAWIGETVMAVRHRELPVEGVQFHPESVLTPDGRRILENFLSAGAGAPAGASAA